MWIETDVGSCWWWSSRHAADGVNSNSTRNLTSHFFLVHVVEGSVAHIWSLSSLCPPGIKIFATAWAAIVGTAATAEGAGYISKLSRRSAVGVTPLSPPPFFPFFPPATPTTASSRMSTAIFQLAIITVLLSLRLANAQSSSPTPVPSPDPLPPNLLVSTNPTAVPLTQIGASEPASPTPTLQSTPASGSVPTFLPNAPPLPNRKRSNHRR